MANCPSCGGMLRYDIPSGKVLCGYCGNDYLPETLDVNAAEDGEMMGMRFFSCPNCGGEVFGTDQDLTGKCSYCGSPVTFVTRMERTGRPDWILPFEKTREDCRENYLRRVKKSVFAPRALSQPEFIDGFRGIYMPYRLQDIRHTGTARCYGTLEHESGDYRVHDLYRLELEVDAAYDTLNHDVSLGFSDDISERVEPFELVREGESTLRPFHPAYLTGFYAEPPTVAADTYDEYFARMARESTDGFLDTAPELVPYTRELEADYPFYDTLLPQDEDAADDALEAMNARDAALRARGGGEWRNLIRSEEKERERGELAFSEMRDAAGKQAKQAEKAEKAENGTKDRYGYRTEQGSGAAALFPLWFLSWRKGSRVNYIAMNGQTGRICADLPIDPKRVFAAAGVLAVLFFLLLDRFTFLPPQVCALSVWLSVLLLLLLGGEQKILSEHEGGPVFHSKRGSEARGAVGTACAFFGVFLLLFIIVKVWSAFDSEIRMLSGPWAMAIYGAIGTALAAFLLVRAVRSGKPGPMPFLVFAGAVFNLAVLFVQPVSDYAFYAAAGAGLLCLPVSMIYMIFRINLAASRPIPQFEHRGVDDNA